MAVSFDRFQKRYNPRSVRETFHQYDPIRLSETRPKLFQAMVRVMFGCDRFCSYCIVPSVRGPEQSRPAADIIEDSYAWTKGALKSPGAVGEPLQVHQKEKRSDVICSNGSIKSPECRVQLCNYPTGMTNEYRRFATCRPLFISARSRAARRDTVLKRTGAIPPRNTRHIVLRDDPGAAITSDFIVGFCGETGENLPKR